MREKIVVLSCLSLIDLSAGGCTRSSPAPAPSQVAPGGDAGRRAQSPAEQAAAGEALARLEAKHFAGVNDPGQILELYGKKFSGWRKVNGDACALWSALDAVDRGAFGSNALRDAVLLRIRKEVQASQPPELDTADDNFDIRSALVAAVGAKDSFGCAKEDSAARHLSSDDPKFYSLQQMAKEKGVDLGHASETARDRVFFHELVETRLDTVMNERAPELVKKLKADDRAKHPYVLACDTRFLKTAAPEESYAVDAPGGDEDHDQITDDLILKVAEGAARNAEPAPAARGRPRAYFEYPPALKRFARVCDGRLNAAWESPLTTAPATSSTIVWQENSTGGDARTDGFWEARALVRLSDKLSGSGPRATPWIFVLGVGFKDRWRLAAFRIAPDRFQSFVGRVTVAGERNVSADTGHPWDEKPRVWKAHARGVEVTCRPAPANVHAGDFPGSCE